MTKLVVSLSGCNAQSTDTLNEKCINNVVYYMINSSSGAYSGYGYMAPKYHPDGTIATCGQPVQ